MKRLVIALVLFMTVFFTNTYCLCKTSAAEMTKIFRQGKFEEVISKAKKELRHHPENLEINLLLGEALTLRLRFAEAIPYLQKANIGSNGVKMKGLALDYLGRCYFAINILDESKAKLKECLELEAPQNIVDDAGYWYNLFGFSERFSNWSTISSEHFIFHFEQPSKVADIGQFTRDYENAFIKIAPFFNVKVPRKIHYFIWNSDELMNVFNTPGGFTKSEYCVIHARYFQSVGHEMTHVFSYYISPFPLRVGLINEGIAVYFDQSGRDQLKLARWLLAEHDIHGVSIRELWSNWKLLSMDDSYPLAGAFVKYLIEHGGEAKFKRLLADQRIENARRIYGGRLDLFINDFEQLVNRRNEIVKLTVLKLNKAYWSSDPQVQNIALKPDPRCFFVELELPRVDIMSDQLGEFPKNIPQEYRNFILTAEGKEPIPLNIETMKAEGTAFMNKINWFLQFEILSTDFDKMEPGIEYRLAAVKADPENRVIISPEVKLTRSVSEK